MLEGVLVRFEQHGQLGQLGSYERLRARCPACHADVQRTFSAKFGRVSGLGDLEPFAFVGLWLSYCTDQQGQPGHHKKFKPTPELVRAYAQGQCWV